MPVDVTPGLQTTGIFQIRGQRSRWKYPDPRQDPERCEVLTNVNLSEFGVADSRYGTTVYNYDSQTLPSNEPVMGLRTFKFRTHGTRHVVVTPDASYSDDGSTRTVLTGSTLTGGNDDRCRFAFIDDTALFTNGVDQVQKWDGSLAANFGDLTGMPWTTCEDIFEHKGILLALAPTEGGTKYNTRVRWSDVDTKTFVSDIGTWPDANRYEVYDDGTAIVGGVDNFGRALIFKEDGLYPGSITYNVGFIEFRPGEPIRGFSPLAKHSLVSRPEFVFGVAREGAFVIRPDMSYEVISLDVQNEWNDLAQGRLQYAQSYIRAKDHQVRTLVSGKGISVGFDRVMVWDWETNDVWFDEPASTMSYGTGIEISAVEQDWFGTTTGRLLKGNLVSYQNDDGTSFPWNVKMAPNDLGFPGRTKHIVKLHTVYRARGGQSSMALNVHRNQGKLPTRSHTVELGAATWDADNKWDTTANWNTAGNDEDVFFVNRHCELVAPEWTANTPASLVGYRVTFQPEE